MRVVFIGTGEIGVPTLRWLLQHAEQEVVGVVTQPDKPVGRAQQIQAPPIKLALEGSPIPIFQPERIKDAEALVTIRALVPDLVVVMAYGQILPRGLLEIPTIACLNLHASLLPRHRGAAPIQAAINAGDSETGMTVMYMDEGLDTGDVLLQSSIAITSDETGGSLHDRLAEIAPAALKKALEKLETGTAPRTPQNASEATYAPKLERDDGRIDWAAAAEQIERRIRAFNPSPGTYALVADDTGRERKLKVFRAVLRAGEERPLGQIVAANANGIFVAAAGGLLQLGDVQMEGKKRMSAEAFVRGHPWIARARFASPA